VTFTELCKRVRKHIGQDYRYAHCVRVARMAENLARIHGADPGKARKAGMLHDLARLYSGERLLAECEGRGVPISDFERAHPIVLHAPLSAELARAEFGVDDADIRSAIAKHTLAAGEMSVLDCVLYLADGLEPGRDYPERAALAEMAGRDLPGAMRATIESSLRYLSSKHLPLAPQTADAMQRFGAQPMTEATTGGHS
jgi:predicted HD superfamily hydrolase involved in NAD metabolism